MQLVKAGQLLNPNVCFICEEFKQEGTPVVDTLRNYELGNHFTPLAGRKYVCESCVVELGACVGLASADRIEQLEKDNVTYRAKIAELKKKLSTFAKELTAVST